MMVVMKAHLWEERIGKLNESILLMKADLEYSSFGICLKGKMYKVSLCLALSLLIKTTTVQAKRFPRIVGGNEISIESVPFMASLEYIPGHICGAAILTEEWVVTAAHCFGKVFAPQLATVRAGTDVRGKGGTLHVIIAIRKYPDFHLKIVDNDLALIKLYPALKFSSKVGPIGVSQTAGRPRVGDMLTVLGWGYTTEKGVPSEKLRGAILPVYPHEDCKKVYRNTLNVTDQMLCVGYSNGGKDACVLDSGGPLVANGTLMGIVSWGWGCARSEHPGVYTDLTVPHLKSWIRQILDSDGKVWTLPR